jgi:hypothetical protein
MRFWNTWSWWLIRLLCLAGLTYLTVQGQVTELWPSWVDVDQMTYHTDVLAGKAGNPWQYRVLSVYLAEGAMRLARLLGAAQPAAAVFLSLRILQTVAIYLVARRYYRRLGLSEPAAWLAMGCLAWNTVLGYYNSDMQFSTYFDVLFYLLAGLILVDGRHLWTIVPLVAAAALNRETSGLIPLMVIASALVAGRWPGVLSSDAMGGSPPIRRRQGLWVGIISLGVYTVIFVALRRVFPPQPMLAFGRGEPFALLLLNVARQITYVKLLGVMGIIPLIGLSAYRTWPGPLRVFFWSLVPAWFAVHLVTAVCAEARLFLVPQALVFLPAAFLAIGAARGATTTNGETVP